VSFGAVSEVALGFTPRSIVSGKTASELCVLSEESHSLHFYTLNQNGALVSFHTHKRDASVLSLVSADVHPDGVSEYVLLGGDGVSVAVIRQRGDSFTERTYPLQNASQRVMVADVNSDKRNDILLFGKRSAGVSTLLGRPDGSFGVGPVLFPEISVSDLKVTDLNGDGIMDVVVLNWLSNQLAVFYGLSRAVFSEQVTVDLPGEPGEVALSPVTRKRTFQVAVTLPEDHKVALFLGDAAGEFEPNGLLPSPGVPQRVSFTNVNEDQQVDLVFGVERGIVVALGTGTSSFSGPVLFGVGSSITSWTLCDMDEDGKMDVALVDQLSRRLMVIANASVSSMDRWSNDYAVGALPSGLAARDLNGDGLIDIAVANAGSGTVSVMFNLGNGRFQGQQAVAVSANPMFLRGIDAVKGVGGHLIASHAPRDRISVIKVDTQDLANSEVYSVPAGVAPYVVLAAVDSLQRIELLVRYSIPAEKTLSLSLFQQIGGPQFIERSIRPNVPTSIVALTVDDISRNGVYDLVLVTNNMATLRSTMSVGFAYKGFDFRTLRDVVSYVDSTVSTNAIITGFINKDQYKDAILSLTAPQNTLGFVYGTANGSFRDSVEWMPDISVQSGDSMILRDVDGDGHPDITYVDGSRGAVMTLYGRGDGHFEPPAYVCDARGVHSIRIAELKNSKSRDLILSRPAKGVVSILHDPFRR
jgi:hypothetical protein